MVHYHPFRSLNEVVDSPEKKKTTKRNFMFICGPNSKVVGTGTKIFGSPAKNQTQKEVTTSVVVDLFDIDKKPIVLTTWGNSHPGQLGQKYLGQVAQANLSYEVSGEGIGVPKVSTYNKFGMEISTNARKIDFDKIGVVDPNMTVFFIKLIVIVC